MPNRYILSFFAADLFQCEKRSDSSIVDDPVKDEKYELPRGASQSGPKELEGKMGTCVLRFNLG
ncbi:hypothetical protein [Sporolactobacillus putidus]|uniref:Uncharacterized protein n=1 Tax=Sporolactobacillus putidus TaxID=492735 RepID=A0A917S272_9BACL|nr:hypothetical protein [Sporolactobacillus putidus]GGL47929.1 hypothetical protein GCM10007968_10190 [Sporolactobacillus putidus]